jgi:hypothetical protein
VRLSATVLVASLACAAPLDAQRLDESRVEWRAPSSPEMQPLAAPRPRQTQLRAPGDVTGRVIPGLLGGVTGLLLGAVGGYALEQLTVGCSHDFCGFAGAVFGAWIGESVGMAKAVHRAGDKEGALGLGVLTNLGVGLAGAALANTTDGFTLLLTPPAQLWANIAVDMKTAEAKRRGP